MERWGGGSTVRILVGGGEDAEAAVTGLGPLIAPTRSLVDEARPGSVAALRAVAEGLASDAVDVVVLSLLGDLDTPIEELRTTLTPLVRRLRDDVAAHVLVLNICTWAPDVAANDRRADRLAILALDLSLDEGISIVDVDRLVAEIGARGHVAVLGHYDDVVHGLVAVELARILGDYGFFETRPLVPQVGREDAA